MSAAPCAVPEGVDVVDHDVVEVATDATLLYTAERAARLYIRTPGGLTGDTFIGGPDVTTSSYGLRLSPGETSPVIVLTAGDTVHAVRAAADDIHLFIMEI